MDQVLPDEDGSWTRRNQYGGPTFEIVGVWVKTLNHPIETFDTLNVRGSDAVVKFGKTDDGPN